MGVYVPLTAEERDKETEFDCLLYMNYPDTFKKTYPKKTKNKIEDIDQYYHDQAYRVVEVYDRRISSFLLPNGNQENRFLVC